MTYQNTTKPLSNQEINAFLEKLRLPKKDSHKGNNGKLFIIGGSNLFHAASRWSLEIASKFVDMVFYSSVPTNNQLILEAKQNFWNGIVVPRAEIENYLKEADCVLIGPGMERLDDLSSDSNSNMGSGSDSSSGSGSSSNNNMGSASFSTKDWDNNTKKIVDYLLKQYPEKKWVIDAGALQMVDPHLLNKNCLITPHQQEMTKLLIKIDAENLWEKNLYKQVSNKLGGCTILAKGVKDTVIHQNKTYLIEGGNAGMTKGGTGDILAGLAAAFYTNSEITTSAVVASHINKKAGDALYEQTGPFFNATDLKKAIPHILWKELKKVKRN
ncbi:MAG: ADP/ATP-dependent (S)-NAD(P)H-hydrate dehydratase [Patescibacteria group bacterium]|nr:ADP/ATP-dependent (S)-NAD(P)H-hydrate dehydratase [Patescibacteria group bacterium]